MKLVRSNRTERLADALADRIQHEPLGPFEREVIVVQSRGMERWLTLELSKRLGIWSNPAFPFPRSVVEDLLDMLDEGSSGYAKAYEPGHLKWSIAELLHEDPPSDLRSYLGDPVDSDRALRFAGTVARAFDDYAVFRPDLLDGWARGEEQGWQPWLWRRLSERLGPHDIASRIKRALVALRGRPAQRALPFRRLHLFSLETLPPAFLELFSALPRDVEATVYSLEPSSAYLGHSGGTDDGELAPDGHPFLGQAGRLSRDFQELLLRFDERVDERDERFEEPERRDLLGRVQADIFEFRPPREGDERDAIDASDASISVHACAGPMREAQALHDLIRAALEDDPSLEPEDVVVMAPDIDTYAPVFRAVFGQRDEKRIPYEVHDRRTRDDAEFFDDFMATLEILDSRFSVLDVARLMDMGSMRATFRFTQDERARLTELLYEAGVRWGIDAAHRAELGFPAEDLHTWRAGLGRLFLGFASAPGTTDVFESLLPRGMSTLEDAELLARLSRLCETLFAFREETRSPRRVEAWGSLLERLVSALFAEDDERSAAARTLRHTIGQLRELTTHSKYAELISLGTLRKELDALLVKGTPAVGFLRRGVTLTELIPLRSVPFRVVCLVGMSEDAFPRGDDRLSFDRMRETHRRGDRNKRHDDRHTFLQALLCARDRLIITYSARAHDPRATANPSPVVWELVESIDRYYERQGQEHALQTTTHPLHAFDSRYFDGGDFPQSASRRHVEIARALRETAIEPEPVVLHADPEQADSAISTSELTRWLWNPMSTFIERVLRARFGESALYEPTHGLTTIGGLETWVIGNGALQAGLEDEALRAFLAAAPEFPDGTSGKLEREALERQVSAIRERASALADGRIPRSELLSVRFDDLTLEGRLDGLFEDQRVVTAFTETERKTELGAWVEHLLMHAADGTPRQTHLVLRAKGPGAVVVTFGPANDARALLEQLVRLYIDSQRSPAPLLEGASRKIVEGHDLDDPSKGARAARAELRKVVERNARLAYVFGTHDPFVDADWVEAFRESSMRVYRALLENRSER